MTYRFKPLSELGWGVAVAVALVILPALVTFNPSEIVEWETWGVALLGASVRAAAGYALDWLRRGAAEPDRIERVKADLLALTPAERGRLTRELEMHGRIEDRMGDRP